MKPIPVCAVAKRLGAKHPSQDLVCGAAIDSRLVREGDLFFALPGGKVDGHRFLAEARKKGACAAVVQENFSDAVDGLALIRVPDVLAALQELARQILPTYQTKVVGITGSLGKTTTKVFAKTFLEGSYSVYASPRSYNSQATVPLSVLNARGDEDVLLLEMGMSAPGQIAQLVSIAPPDVAVLTKVALQHAVHFPEGIEGIRREKSAIFSHPATEVGLMDHALLSELKSCGSCPKQTFSCVEMAADIALIDGVVHQGKRRIPLDLKIPMPAHHHNVAAAIAIARHFGVPWKRIQEAAPRLKLPPMRFEQVDYHGVTFINDAYNANPDAMIAALQSLPTPGKGRRRIAVLTAMTELGQGSQAGHESVAQEALTTVDELLCFGQGCEPMSAVWQKEQRLVHHFETHEALTMHLKAHLCPGDVVLLKGARSASLETVLEEFQ